MNKDRIEELASQAYSAASLELQTSDPAAWFSDRGPKQEMVNTKFAELIIEECIEVVIKSDPSPKLVLHEPYRTIMNNIVEHFGIDS